MKIIAAQCTVSSKILSKVEHIAATRLTGGINDLIISRPHVQNYPRRKNKQIKDLSLTHTSTITVQKTILYCIPFISVCNISTD